MSTSTGLPTILSDIETEARHAITGGLASLGAGGDAETAGASIAKATVAAAVAAIEAKIGAALAPIHDRIEAVEDAATSAVSSDPAILPGIIAILKKMFPHETAELEKMVAAPAAPAP